MNYLRLLVLLYKMISRFIRIIPAFVILVLALSCASRVEWSTKIDWDDLEFSHLPGLDEYPESGAFILLDEAETTVIRRGEINYSEINRHRIIKILDNRGHKYANIAIPYSPPSQIVSLQARTISPDGTINVITEDDIYDINLYPDFVFYSDQRAKLLAVPAVEDGAVLEYNYLLRISDPIFNYSWTFQAGIPTLISRFSLTVPEEWDLNYRIYGIELKADTQRVVGGTESTYIWEARDVPALKSEFGMPPANESIIHMALAPVGIETWEDVANWYRGLTEPQIQAGDGVKQLASLLTSRAENDEEKLRAIYEWVRDRVRYVAVSIGIGGYQPRPAEEILRNRYGDCKDMTTLLCSLAREAGLEAYEVILSTWQNGIPDTSLATPFQFNHAIAYCPSVGAGGVWMDATEKGCPYGQLPWYDQDLPVLVVGPEGEPGIRTTPRVLPDSNRMSISWEVALQPTGAAVVQGRTHLSGALATEIREDLSYWIKEERQQWVERYLVSRCTGARLDSFTIDGLSPVSDPLTISYTFHTSTFATARENELIIRPGQIMASELPDYFSSSTRTHPIRFNYGLHSELDLEINLPLDYQQSTADSSDSLVSLFGSASSSWAVSDSHLNVQKNYRLLGQDIDPRGYEAFQDFLDSISELDLEEIVLFRD